MNFDLFPDDLPVSASEYREAFAHWLESEVASGRTRLETSASTYEHMWSAFADWAVVQHIGLNDLRPTDLETYLDSRGGHDELSARYAWRLLRLIDRVIGQDTRLENSPANRAAAELLNTRPDLRFANAAERVPLPAFLHATEAKRLVTFLSAVRPARGGSAARGWQDVRNRASVGLMLGAGLTPGEVRRAELGHIVVDGGKRPGTPWKVKVDGSASAPARETPVAPWAGELLRYWLVIRNEQRIPGRFLFPARKGSGKDWGKVSQYEATKTVLSCAGLDDVEGGSFRLRHTFALRQLKRGTDPVEVARWLGVSDLGVMDRYARVLTAPVDVI